MAGPDPDRPLPLVHPVSSQHGPNRYRPYYTPRSTVGSSDFANGTLSSGISQSNPPGSASTPVISSSVGPIAIGPDVHSAPLTRQARSILTELERGGDRLLADQSVPIAEWARRIAEHAAWNYVSVGLAQPFEVARTVLQVVDAGSTGPAAVLAAANAASSRVRRLSLDPSRYSNSDEGGTDESDNEAAFHFTDHSTSSATWRATGQGRPINRLQRRSRLMGTAGASPASPFPLVLARPDSVTAVMSSLWKAEGVAGVWKATHATFVYKLLLRTVESWTRSFLAALLDTADPGPAVVGAAASPLADSSSPWAGVAVAVAAAVSAALLLSPLDIVRTRAMLTESSATQSGVRQKTVPAKLVPITVLHAAIPAFVVAYTPVWMRTKAGIDPIVSPALHAVGAFTGQLAELVIRLPLETVLRRGQASVISEWRDQEAASTSGSGSESGPGRPGQGSGLTPASAGIDRSGPGRRRKSAGSAQPKRATETGPVRWIVKPGSYSGSFVTMWNIVWSEGSRPMVSSPVATPSATPTTAGGPAEGTGGVRGVAGRQIGRKIGGRRVGNGSEPEWDTGRETDQDSRLGGTASQSDRPGSGLALASSVGPPGSDTGVGAIGRNKKDRKSSIEMVLPGQGLAGLWRGWKVGFWGLVGVWAAAGLGAISGGDPEF